MRIDITKADQLQNLFEQNEFEWFIHTAAYTDVDGCEKNKIQAEQVNSDSVELIAKLCAEHNRKLCLISTDYVFDGKVEITMRTPRQTPYNITGSLSSAERTSC